MTVVEAGFDLELETGLLLLGGTVLLLGVKLLWGPTVLLEVSVEKFMLSVVVTGSAVELARPASVLLFQVSLVNVELSVIKSAVDVIMLDVVVLAESVSIGFDVVFSKSRVALVRFVGSSVLTVDPSRLSVVSEEAVEFVEFSEGISELVEVGGSNVDVSLTLIVEELSALAVVILNEASGPLVSKASVLVSLEATVPLVALSLLPLSEEKSMVESSTTPGVTDCATKPKK